MTDIDSSAIKTPLSIVYQPPSSLVPYEKNPRRHSKKQIEQVARSMHTFGPIVPVLTDADGKIIVGHPDQWRTPSYVDESRLYRKDKTQK